MESKLQGKIIRYLEKRKWYVLKVIRCNKSGHPDIEAFREGKVFFIECKNADKEAKPLQEYRHDQLRGHGFPVFVIDDYKYFLTVVKKFNLL